MRNEIHVFQWDIDSKLPDEHGDAVEARFKMAFNPNVEEVRKLVAAGVVQFKKVAVLLNTSNLDYAYERTNTINGPWYEDNVGTSSLTGVTLEKKVEGGVRSTSCGDILVHVTDEKTTGYMVAAFGFTTLPAIDLFGIEL